MSQENSTEEKFLLIEANIITLIEDIKSDINLNSDETFKIINRGFLGLKKRIESHKSFYGENLKSIIPIYEEIFNKLKNIQNKNLDYGATSPIQESHYFDFHIHEQLENINYEVRGNLSNHEFEYLWDEISTNRINLEDHLNKKIYINANQSERENLSKTILNLRNSLYNNSSNGINLRNANYDTYLKIFESYTELNKLKAQVKEINDSHEMLTKIKENKAIENTYELQNGYQDEVANSAKEIKKLNRIIIILFFGIAAIITTKILLIIYMQELFKDIYNFLTYLSLLVTLSALITYFIKERNRLIKLHDYFNLTVLELKTLPQYMRELDSAQRKNLIINLSSSFFRGSNKFLPTNEQEQSISNTDISNIVSNTIKFLNEQKK
ncbi:hypothetical protein F892_01726 [Acinetobacter vivianii]|uniref:Uncharacterized protein n=1 Tax=Acinetobacter vivianii TaxID=1776742 RepID=N9NN39_9GAMM|nr:hypothetical protein [Acinetobacter vivianii]ENX22484.1 hypothetical protein F892_01726 [Acinetobacter vivianii]GGI58853.1 hypothetical protein GCM10011446_03480 [Acinetobacter vivianii]